jgi:hypothetical protein
MRALLIDPEQRIITLVQVILVTAKVRGQSRTSRCSFDAARTVGKAGN